MDSIITRIQAAWASGDSRLAFAIVQGHVMCGPTKETRQARADKLNQAGKEYGWPVIEAV